MQHRTTRLAHATAALITAALITAGSAITADACTTPRPVTVHAWHASITIWPAPPGGPQPQCTRAQRGQIRIWAYTAGGPAWLAQCRAEGQGRQAWDWFAPLH